MEERGVAEHRRLLLEGLRGTVVELGAGHGLNFPHYPTEVAEVIAIEPEPTLRAAGELRFYEHVVPEGQPKRFLFELVDRSGIWPKLAGGCHPARDTAAAIERAGFQIQSRDTVMVTASRLQPSVPHILGVAAKAG
jgi:hypothetical protein